MASWYLWIHVYQRWYGLDLTYYPYHLSWCCMWVHIYKRLYGVELTPYPTIFIICGPTCNTPNLEINIITIYSLFSVPPFHTCGPTCSTLSHLGLLITPVCTCVPTNNTLSYVWLLLPPVGSCGPTWRDLRYLDLLPPHFRMCGPTSSTLSYVCLLLPTFVTWWPIYNALIQLDKRMCINIIINFLDCMLCDQMYMVPCFQIRWLFYHVWAIWMKSERARSTPTTHRRHRSTWNSPNQLCLPYRLGTCGSTCNYPR